MAAPTEPQDDEFDPLRSALGRGLAHAAERLERARRPFIALPDDLPAPDADLAPLALATVVALPGPLEDVAFDDYAGRVRNLAREMAGETALSFLNARLIMLLRRRDAPDRARRLFFRIWDETGADLAGTLSTRWRVSTAQTFSDHGRTESERLLGAEIVLLFGMVKLYETERRLSGLPPWKPFPSDSAHPGRLPLGLAPYDVTSGDLARNLIGRVWTRAEHALPGPMALIACALLTELDISNRTVLHRLARMRARQASSGPEHANSGPSDVENT
jgi:hypothetical protein